MEVFFLGFCSVLSFGTYFFVLSFWLPPCVCFYALGRAAMHPGFGRTALCSKCLGGCCGTAYLITQAGHSRWASLLCVGCTHPPVVVEPDLLHQREDVPQAKWLQRPATTIVWDQLCRDQSHGAGLISVRLWCPVSPLPLECVSFGKG